MTPITAPGVYDIPIELYHSQACCDGPSVSSSGLRTIERACPAKFFATSELNPSRYPSVDKQVYALGRAAHAKVLGEPEFNAHFIISPFDDFRSKIAQEWRDSQTRTILKIADLTVVDAMAAAQLRSPQVARAFREGKPEQSIIWRDPETELWLKARPDWLPTFPAVRFTCEYKSAVSIEPAKLSRDVFSYGYELQAAMMLDGIEIVMGVVPLGIAHIVQEKDPPYLCDMRIFTSEQIEFGRLQYRRAVRTLARCIERNEWPGYTDGPKFFETPPWVAYAMENFDDHRHTDADHEPHEYLDAG